MKQDFLENIKEWNSWYRSNIFINVERKELLK